MEALPTKRLILTLFAVCFSVAVFAQRGGSTAWKKYRHEASVGYGVNNVYAQLGERDNLGVAYVMQRSTFNGSYRYYFLKNFAARGSISHGYSRKNDKTLNFGDRQNERIDYLSTVSEFAAMAEYHVFDEVAKSASRGRVRRSRGGMTKGMKLGLSFFAGAGLSYFRPYGEMLGELMEFKPITEPLTIPNEESYKRFHVHFPVGINARILINENWRVGLEAGYRIGIRDYIDNVSGVYAVDPEFTNPDPDTPDKDYFGIITFAEEKAPIADLANDNGQRNYFFSFLTLSYRLKL